MTACALEVERLCVHFGSRAVLDNVSFELAAGETLSLVGESGCGKSTLARALLRLIPASSGRILWQDQDLLQASARELRRLRREIQIVFQDPLASLNPRMRVGDAVAEPLRIHEPDLSARAAAARACEMLERVGLQADHARRYPHAFSGGQCQRIAIARAMILRPRLLVCDEVVSALDLSLQGQIINLLSELQREFATALLFISHNLAVVRYLSHQVMVMQAGQIVESGPCDALFDDPRHPYTRALLRAERALALKAVAER